MFIIFGTRRMRKALGTVMLLCQRCQRPSAHAVFMVRTWFTLFFHPHIPCQHQMLQRAQCVVSQCKSTRPRLNIFSQSLLSTQPHLSR